MAFYEASALPSLLEHDHEHEHDHDLDLDQDLEHLDDYYDQDSDRSYKFSFESDGHSREEEADKNGLVIGKYTYVDDAGVQRTLTYKAGANLGFVPDFTGFGSKVQDKKKEPLSNPSRLVQSLIPQQVQVQKAPAQATPLPVPKTLYQAPTPVLVVPQTLYQVPLLAPVKTPVAPAKPPTLYQAPATLYEAPAPPENLPTSYEAPAALPSSLYEALAQAPESAPAAPVMMPMDASYSFAYDSQDSSRFEEADSNGNVVGSYTYVGAEGQTIQVRYSAGAEKGFVIENETELQDAVAESVEAAELAQMAQDTFNYELGEFI